MKKLYVLLCIALCLYSCKTVPKGNVDKVYYEYNEQGVPQYAVMIYDPKTGYITYIATHVNGNSIVWIDGIKSGYNHQLGFRIITDIIRINGLSLESCRPLGERYDLTYFIDHEKNGGAEIYFVGALPTEDKCIVPHNTDFFPQKLKRVSGIDYNRFWPPHHDVIKALNEGKSRNEAREILIRNVREEGKRQDEKQRRILERLQQEQDSTKKKE
ncbi:hypothetical protein AAG747_17380 [Rapidithrix thailandica]|uniref:Lipoprotein n=1 Tax=Rapidithrix thailandica TaxID=413964 RepID=A0AAW9S9P7_9BACT